MAGIVPDNRQILTWIGLDTDCKRDGVTANLLHPNGFVHLKNENSDGIIAACMIYSKELLLLDLACREYSKRDYFF